MTKSTAPINRFRYFTSFRAKLMLTYMLLILLPVMMLGGYCISMMREFSLSRAEQTYEESLQQMSNTLSYKLVQSWTVAQYIARNAAIARVLQDVKTTSWERYLNYKNIIDPFIESLLSINADVVSLVIYQDNPVLVNHSPTIRKLSELGEAEWLDHVIAYDDIWRIDNQQLCLDTRLMNTYTGAPITLLELRLNARNIFKLSFDTIDTYALSVTNDSGETLWMLNNLNTSEAQTDNKISIESNIATLNGEHYRLYHNGIDGTNWKINMAIPQSQLEISTLAFSGTIMIVTLLCIFLMLPLAFLFARSFVSRINFLNRQMILVEHGNLEATIDTPYRDEIGLLMQHFNDMLHSMRKSMEHLSLTEKMQKEAEMRALRAQINPHFLYNTLSLINWKAIDQGAFEVAKIAGIFSKFCRTVLNRGKSESALVEELVNVQCYVDIQREMHEGSFDISYDVPDALKNCIVPNFVLQPLVENAIMHGLDTVRGLRGSLHIAVINDNNDLLIRISNNGTPFVTEALQSVLSSTERGYGLRNVQERVMYLYGEGYGLTLETPAEGYTTCVVLRLKLCLKDEQEAASSKP